MAGLPIGPGSALRKRFPMADTGRGSVEPDDAGPEPKRAHLQRGAGEPAIWQVGGVRSGVAGACWGDGEWRGGRRAGLSETTVGTNSPREAPAHG